MSSIENYLVIIRVFPSNVRKSLYSMTIKINSKYITLEEFIKNINEQNNKISDTRDFQVELNLNEYKFSKGIEFLSRNSIITNNDIINIIPLEVKGNLE
jgi:hypothetical protein